MAKRTAVKDAPKDGINPKQPCPCGSGKRYKACHGAPGGATDVIVSRPFEGLAAECELIALREFVPSAIVKLPVKDGREVTLATVLPMAAMRPDPRRRRAVRGPAGADALRRHQS